MNDYPFDTDDARLTAYALGELPEGEDRAAVEELLAASPDARATVQGIREVTALLVAEYDDERAHAEEIEPAVSNPRARRGTVIRIFSRDIRLPSLWGHPLLEMAALLLIVAGSSTWLFHNAGQHRQPLAVSRYSEPMELYVAPSPSLNEPSVEPATPESSAAGGGVTEAAKPQEPSAAKSAEPAADSFKLTLQPPADRAKDSGTISNGNEILPAKSSAPLDGRIAALPLPASSAPAPPSPPTAFAGSATGMGGAGKAKAATTAYAFAKRAPAGEVNDMALRATVQAERSRRSTSTYTVTTVTTGPVALETRSAKATAPADYDRSVLDESRLEKEPHADTATYDHLTENAFLSARENPLSTFSIDVDTASYANVRRFIESGTLPPKDAVRIEEMLNYFPTADAPPAEGDPHPFALHLEAASCPWNTEHRLVRIGIKGREMARDKRPPSNLVFLIDVSGSMMPPERLPLIKESLRMLVEKLSEDDHVAIVVYAGNSGLALPSTSGDHKEKILSALGHLEAGGSTNGADGIQLAYKVAQENFIKGGVNRVILATDGDFNVGITSQAALVRLIEKEAKGGVFLSALGVGTDNYKDSTMQKLADKGNGNYAYIDRLEEGRKVLVEQMSGTLVTIAKDVKIQVEFNPAAVASYRLIGYEKRMLRKEDFNDDKVDAGEIGAGHSVTALYEVVPTGQAAGGGASGVDSLKYQTPAAAVTPAAPTPATVAAASEMLTLKMRYKAPDAEKSERAYEQPLVDHPAAGDLGKASVDFKFAAALAGFGLVLRDSPHKGDMTMSMVAELARDGRGEDANGYRTQFLDLVRKAQALASREGRDE